MLLSRMRLQGLKQYEERRVLRRQLRVFTTLLALCTFTYFVAVIFFNAAR